MEINKIYQGDCLEVLKTFPDECVDCIITSPPYWGLRDYGVEGQLGLEKTLDEYLNKMLLITAELKRVLKKTGTMWWNHGDCYGSSPAGNNPENVEKWGEKGDGFYKRLSIRHRQGNSKNKPTPKSQSVPKKCLALQNWRLILRMIDEQQWILRNVIVWHKPNHMPSSVKDRLTNSYEPVFFLTKSRRYFFDLDAIRVPHKTMEKRPLRSFNYCVRDAEKKSEQCPQFKATKEEIEKYKFLGHQNPNRAGRDYKDPEKAIQAKMRWYQHKTHYPQDQAESFGSPRARYWRKQKFITPEQQKETQEKTGWIEGSGRIRSFFDNFGGQTNPRGKNPGDIIFPDLIEELSAKFHEIYQEEAKRQGDVRHKDDYNELSENIKEFDRVLARWVLQNFQIKQDIPNDIWRIPTQPAPPEVRGKHFATFPEKLVEPMIKAGCPLNGIVLDPFMGSGTIAVVAKKLGRNYIGIELNPEYIETANKRISAIPEKLI